MVLAQVRGNTGTGTGCQVPQPTCFSSQASTVSMAEMRGSTGTDIIGTGSTSTCEGLPVD